MLEINTALQGCLVVYHEQPEIGKAVARVFGEKLPGLRVKTATKNEDILHLANQYCPIVVWVDTSTEVEKILRLNALRTDCAELRFIGFSMSNIFNLRLKLAWEKEDVLFFGPISWNKLAVYFAAHKMILKIKQDEKIGLVKLTRRQLQFLNCLHHGMSNQDISQSLAISESTVKVHFWRLYKRMGVSNRVQAILKAQKMGYLQS